MADCSGASNPVAVLCNFWMHVVETLSNCKIIEFLLLTFH